VKAVFAEYASVPADVQKKLSEDYKKVESQNGQH
jgi:hypothetical protein